MIDRASGRDNRKTVSARQLVWGLIGLTTMLFGLWMGARTAQAAVALAYFEPIAQADRVRVAWGTTEEYDLLGFRVYCKGISQPDSAYHAIGGLISATGSLTVTADYTLDAFGLTPGVQYCFQLQEITSNGEPGEVFERCGYGLNITPTAPPTDTPTITPTATPTATSSPTPTPTLDVTPTPTITKTPTATPTSTPQPSSTPFPAYVVYTATFTPTPRQQVATLTPLATVTPQAGSPLTGLLAPGQSTPAVAATATAQPSLLASTTLVGLLCLSTLGAGGLGLLALLGGLFFMRSRRDDQVKR